MSFYLLHKLSKRTIIQQLGSVGYQSPVGVRVARATSRCIVRDLGLIHKISTRQEMRLLDVRRRSTVDVPRSGWDLNTLRCGVWEFWTFRDR